MGTVVGMNIAEIIKRLRELQIEQNTLIDKLHSIHSGSEDDQHLQRTDDDCIQIGDKVRLNTGGVRCRVGDEAIVTKCNEKTVHFRVTRNGHHSYKKISNVTKIQE